MFPRHAGQKYQDSEEMCVGGSCLLHHSQTARRQRGTVPLPPFLHPGPQSMGWCHSPPSLLEGSTYILDMSSPLFLKPRSLIAPGMYFRNHLAVLTQAS